MSQSVMTVRLDAQMKSQFDELCEQFGMSANTAFNIFVKAVIRSRSIPFPITGDQEIGTREKAMQAFDSIRAKAEASLDAEMTLEDINQEIHTARMERNNAR